MCEKSSTETKNRIIRLTFSDQHPTDLKLGSYLFLSPGHTPLSEPTNENGREGYI